LSLLWTGLAANDSAREFFKFAKFSYDANEYDKALVFINKAIDIDPDYLNGLILRADINFKLQNYYAIISDVNQVLKLDEQTTSWHGHVYTLRGTSHYFINKPDKAASDFRQALSSNPENEMAHFYLGLMAYNKHSYFQALEHFDQAIMSNSQNYEYYFYRAKTKIDNYNPIPGTPTFDNIMADIDQAINLNPEDHRSYKLRCNMLKLNEKKARETYMDELSKSIELFPQQADLYAQRGMARILDYKFVDALSDLDKAIAFSGSNGLTLRNRALCHHNLSNYTAAVQDYTSSIELLINKFQQEESKSAKKMLAETFVMRGRTYQQLSNPDDACSDFYNAAKLGSKTGLNNYRRNCNVYN